MTDINPVVAILGIISALVTAGFFNLLLSTLSGRRGRKVDEVEKLSKMQAEFRDEIRRDNAALVKKMEGVERAVIHLTNVFNDVFPRVEGLTPNERIELRDALDSVRLAV